MGKIDGVKTDRGFSISHYLESNGASLTCQPSLNVCEKLKKAIVKESQAIGSVRIY